jgi:TRAP-type C4-dicarboxylate transport system permease small subunit
METVFQSLRVVAKTINIIAGAALTFMMMLTVADIFGRAFGRPILGTYEIVSLTLGCVIGFGIPKVSLDRGHVFMEFLVEKLSPNGKKLMHTFTRLLCLGLFILIGYNLFTVGAEFHASGEVSPTIKLPFFPVAYGIGVCCWLECFVFMYDIAKIWRNEYV